MKGEKVQIFNEVDNLTKVLEHLRSKKDVATSLENFRSRFIKKIEACYNSEKNKGETLAFKGKLDKIGEIKENNVEDQVKNLIKILEDFIKVISKQIRPLRKILGHTSLFATKNNVESLNNLNKQLCKIKWSEFKSEQPKKTSSLAKGSSGSAQKTKPPIKGLNNPGNACYLIAAIQQLYKIKTFREDVLNCQINDSDKNGKNKELYAMQRLFRHLANKEKLNDNEIHKYQNILGYAGIQKDSAEAMRSIKDCCEKQLKKVEKRSNNNPKMQYAGNMITTLPMESVEYALNEYALGERAWREQRVNECAKNGNAEDTCKIEGICIEIESKKFIIEVNRSSDQNRAMKVHEELLTKDLKNIDFCENSKKIQVKKFNLVGVTIYRSSENAYGRSGHYYVYSKQGSGWVCKNDSAITKNLKWKDIEKNVCKNCRVLVYKKAN